MALGSRTLTLGNDADFYSLILTGGQYASHGVGEDCAHALLDVGIFASDGMPAVGDVSDFLSILRVDQAVLIIRDRMERIFGETDFFIEFHHRQSPFCSELPNRSIVRRSGVVPMGGQDNDCRFS